MRFLTPVTNDGLCISCGYLRRANNSTSVSGDMIWTSEPVWRACSINKVSIRCQPPLVYLNGHQHPHDLTVPLFV